MTGSPNPPSCATSLAWLLQRVGDRLAVRRSRVPDGTADPVTAEPAPVG